MTTENPTFRILRENVTEDGEHVDLGATDKRGRTIGAMIFRGEYDAVEAPAGARSYYNSTTGAGHMFTFRPWATRNGKTYGAWQYGRSFESAAERDAAIEAYLKDARKRAAKAGA